MGIVRYMVKEVMKEIDNKSREFYEFVLPPLDMFYDDNELRVVIDIPGFEKNDIKLTLKQNVLSIKAEKESEEKESTMICNQRPKTIDKKIGLPIYIKEGEEEVTSAKYENGVLTVVITSPKSGKSISID
ncbi:MAG: Hsp20 family protein [Nitrosopumilaceae archaeon]|nr:Hsp20/alpha crystallin family protein [Nitrosopumilaceae archaeon]NIU00799.1 Hsp20/alpha crystallin family protein [Nitrosopumilaceae archaeon]NIU87252.1 Hsp20 family protein [Nitrosopumilaceae archaeon]NIV65780.1 Hsp20 family protein [Nitrosopumilaceae archaeon]NIX61401.1 Hsp20 family protein [Nitrosopumilaceae archaeon]